MAPEYHLIVTEGESTEPKYFEGIRQVINGQYRDRIQITIKGEGKNTLSLLERAVRIASNDPNPIGHVWIVFDKDDFRDEQFNQTISQCEVMNREGSDIRFHALWSNECFELWFVLHFAYQHTGLSRDQYIKKLDKYLASYGGYSKTRDGMYSILLPKLPTAIRNAKKLRQSNERKSPAISNPGTVVYEIMEYLYPYLMETTHSE